MSKEFSIEREVVLPAAPEDVFAAVTTGTANWMFPTPAPEPDSPLVKNWEPPNRYSVRQEGDDGWFNALDFIISARDGGTAALRYVHSGIFTDDWDDQYDGASRHTDFYHHTLSQYLRHFKGKSAVYAEATGPAASSRPDAMDTLRKALDASIVERTVRFEIPGLAPADAVVDYVTPYFIGLRISDALYRFFGRNHFGGTVDVSAHLFGDDADRERTEQALRAYLNEVFPA